MLRLTVLILISSALSAQTFESASVKPFAPQDEDSTPVREPGSMVYSNVSLKLIITAAYGVRPDQITGPAWLDTERYDIVAKPPAGATKDQIPVMLQNLLADRFRMVVRIEDRPRASYALVVGKDGPKLKRTKAITGVDLSVAADHVDITGATVSAFAGMLASFVGRPVADMTGIEGTYDFRLNLTITDLKAASPSIFTAIQDLGLTLESRTSTARYLIVDRAEN
jgi:uncharacterized protein (TIGR03435 family)